MQRKLLSWSDGELKIKGDEGIFEGYASKFGGVDSYNDTIIPGAYLESLKVKMPVMYFNHISYRSDMPAKIGRYDHAEEDSQGLLVRAKLTMDHPIVKASWPSIKEGLFDGMSIGYNIPEGGATFEGNVRALRKINLHEISLVEEPADGAARVNIDSVKSVTTLREAEEFLRDAGLSANVAKAALAQLKGIFCRDDIDPSTALVAELKRIYGA